MNNKIHFELEREEVALMRGVLYGLKFGFEGGKFDFWEYISSPIFKSLLHKSENYILIEFNLNKVEMGRYYTNDTHISKISKKIIEIVSDISEWENIPNDERTRIVVDLFYPYQPKNELIDEIIKNKDQEMQHVSEAE